MRHLLVVIIFISTSCSHATYYIVRHAEKEQGTSMMSATAMTTDVPLSAAGARQAEILKERLMHKRISAIYSTNTIRTRSTAEPLSKATGVNISFYNAADSTFLKQLKKKNGNFLIVGHSNTVDDIANFLSASLVLKDLPDSSYGDLFVITKQGARFTYRNDRLVK